MAVRFDKWGADDEPLEISSMPQYGIERIMGEDDSIPDTEASVRFRCYDDDGELTHTGSLDDDEDCMNQSAALRAAETDAGATRIEVYRQDEWKQEIA